MNRPDRNNFDENEIHKYIILMEQYVDKLENDIDDLEYAYESLEDQIEDKEGDIKPEHLADGIHLNSKGNKIFKEYIKNKFAH